MFLKQISPTGYLSCPRSVCMYMITIFKHALENSLTTQTLLLLSAFLEKGGGTNAHTCIFSGSGHMIKLAATSKYGNTLVRPSSSEPEV